MKKSNVACTHCNKPIYRKPSQIKRSKSGLFFCSKECQQLEQRIGGKLKVSHYGEVLEKKCAWCGRILENKRNKFCNINCASQYRHDKDLNKALKELESGTLSDSNARIWFRKISENKCYICGLTEWNGKPIPLVVDHIDGNHYNNYISNLRMICCNCDALLPTYKAKNKGNGRKNRLK